MTNRQIENWMTRGSLRCRRHDTLSEAASRMWEGDCGALPVVDDDERVVGVITDRDVCMAAFTTGQNLDTLQVDRAMSSQVVTAPADGTLSDALHLLRSHRVRRLPVVDARGGLVGILSLADLARALVDTTAPAAVDLSHEMVALALADIVAPRRPERETLDVIEVKPQARQEVAFDEDAAAPKPRAKSKKRSAGVKSKAKRGGKRKTSKK